jgi:hypothetical protein
MTVARNHPGEFVAILDIAANAELPSIPARVTP